MEAGMTRRDVDALGLSRRRPTSEAAVLRAPAISSTSGLLTAGWQRSRVLWMWITIAIVSGLASLAGLFQNSSPDSVAFVLAFAAGAILTMPADTMMPAAFQTAASWSESSRPSASPWPTPFTRWTDRSRHGPVGGANPTKEKHT